MMRAMQTTLLMTMIMMMMMLKKTVRVNWRGAPCWFPCGPAAQ